ncbi:hypothetical protein [Jeongeupia naejangsanensis]|uniref:Uncharacterized protein n=1 Tax=Jeongeupia naejangsanensis TaxID=613195 RepID=A0ABS2BG73_9NEIS|nr:hypothetical protein [Jeongeupia naejangsanensis]MBM3114470.1 hypothetical protein [Jeongeupia naejangsanensis]
MSDDWDFSACQAGVCYGLESELRTHEGRHAVAGLQRFATGAVACLQGGGGLVSNLRVWENLILPAWYHESAAMADLEVRIAAVLDVLAVAEEERASLMASLPASLSRSQCRVLALVRALVQAPAWLVVEVEWLEWLQGAANIHCKEAFGLLRQDRPMLLLGAGAMLHAEPLPTIVDTKESDALAER